MRKSISLPGSASTAPRGKGALFLFGEGQRQQIVAYIDPPNKPLSEAENEQLKWTCANGPCIDTQEVC